MEDDDHAPGFRALLVTAYITANSSAALLMMVYRPECEPVLSLPVKVREDATVFRHYHPVVTVRRNRHA